MKKLTIVHYLPVSFYPPAMNLVDILEDKSKIQLISTSPDKGTLMYSPQKARMSTPIRCKDINTPIVRLVKYLWFSLYTLWKLIIRKPDAILYYESISALPVYLYKRYINNSVNVYVHYHEYTSEEEYHVPGMRLFKMNHDIERRWLYTRCTWISQTNKQRVKFFLKDNPMIIPSSVHILPNYPPKSWWKKQKKHTRDICKCVYVGSLSIQDTFVKEFCEWISKQNGKVIFDIYSFNFHQDTLDYVNSLNCPYIKFYKKGVPYTQVPNILDNYDVGILLYKAANVNFRWNETNKFYEYLICGLDIWYPKNMQLLHELDKKQFAPQVKEMDFDNLNAFDASVKRGIVDNNDYRWFADDIYNEFIKTIE